MAVVCACNILVKTRDQAEKLKKQLDGGSDFAWLAKKHSTCPSGNKVKTRASFAQGRWSRILVT